ncbi:MAG: helix-turn-helix domain-containing protein [bacterium]
MHPQQKAEDGGREVAEALRRKIRQAGLSYSEVERRLGMGRDYLRQLLAGRVDLKVKHVFGVLAALGVEPADFFAELLGPPTLAATAARTGYAFHPEFPASLLGVQSGVLWFLARKLKDKGLFTDDEVDSLVREFERGGPRL